MIGDEFNEIITSGEFSEPITLIYDNVDYVINCMVFQGWKRSETDGVLTTKLPRKATTFKIWKSSLPSIVLDDNKLNNILFEYNSIVWKVVYVIGKEELSFMVTVEDDVVTDDEVGDKTIEELSDDDAPGLV